MRRKQIGIVLCAVCMMLTAGRVSAAETKERYLQEQRLLQEYAWEQEYVQQGPYDVAVYMNGYEAVMDIKDALCPMAYAIMDFDQDNHLELLVIGAYEDEYQWRYYRLQMYEVMGDQVVLTAETDTSITVINREAGNSHVFFCKNVYDELQIGCEHYANAYYFADGIDVRAEMYRYDGRTFMLDGAGGMGGSAFTDEAFLMGFQELGIELYDISRIYSGERAIYQYAEDASVILSVKNEIYDVSSTYDQRSSATQSNPFVFGYRDYKRNCWLPADICKLTWGTQTGWQIPSEETQPVQNDPSEGADYLYVSWDRSGAEYYYLKPDTANGVYHVYDVQGAYVKSVVYDNAKQLIDCSNLDPGNSQRALPVKANARGAYATIVWMSPYGLCAYSHSEREYQPLYGGTDTAGNPIWLPADTGALKYILNETKVDALIDYIGIRESGVTVPCSAREQ